MGKKVESGSGSVLDGDIAQLFAEFLEIKPASILSSFCPRPDDEADLKNLPIYL